MNFWVLGLVFKHFLLFISAVSVLGLFTFTEPTVSFSIFAHQTEPTIAHLFSCTPVT